MIIKRYSEEHVWAAFEDGIATIGITVHAAKELGDITYVEVPELKAKYAQDDPLCVIESVKAASDVFAPVGGTVSEANARLDSDPGLINQSPEKDGWICRFKDVDAAEMKTLMTEEEYEEFVAGTKKR